MTALATFLGPPAMWPVLVIDRDNMLTLPAAVTLFKVAGIERLKRDAADRKAVL